MCSPYFQPCTGAQSGAAANQKASSRIKTWINHLQKRHTKVLKPMFASILASVLISQTFFLVPAGVLHLRRRGGGGGEGRSSSRRTGQTGQRPAPQVQGPLLQEAQILRRLRAHDRVYVPPLLIPLLSPGCAASATLSHVLLFILDPLFQ